jgi:hypothetical protein
MAFKHVLFVVYFSRFGKKAVRATVLLERSRWGKKHCVNWMENGYDVLILFMPFS